MRFLNFINTLLSSFTQNSVLESAEITRTSIQEHTLPAYQAAAELWKGTKFKSPEGIDFQTQFARKVNSKPMFETITKALENSLQTLTYLSDHGKKVFNKNETKVSLTYVKSTMLRLIQSAEYVNTYARRFLNYIYIVEGNKLNPETATKLPNAEVTWLEDGFDDFCLCINVLLLDLKTIEKSINELPDATVTDLTEKTFISTIGDKKLDPFQLRHLSAKVNPFYLIGMYFAKADANRYKAAQEELELLQLRKLQMEKQMAKQPDAKLEKEIEYMQNRVSALVYKIEKMEKEYGI